jgi:hypothetical protein
MVLALRLGAQDAAGPVLPDTAYARLVGPSVKLIEAALAGEPTRRTAEKARVGALMLAEFAQQNLQGADAGQRATVRDAALQVAALIKDKKYAEAVKLAKELPTLPANPAAKKERLKLLGNHLDMEELMSQFRSAKLGGLGVEALLDELASSKDGMVPAAALTDELRLLAFRTAVAAELVRAELPKMKPQVWRDHAEMMRKASLELAGAVETKNGKEAFAAVERLNASCNKCHLVFRQ